MYLIGELADLANITTRTIRFYEEKGLLYPHGYSDSGYRLYSDKEVDRLQKILLFREFGMPIKEIKKLMTSKTYSSLDSLNKHVAYLEDEKLRLEKIICMVKKTIAYEKGESTMTNDEKFEAFKKDMIQKNEKTYGEEARKKYGDEEVDTSNEKVMQMSEKDMNTWQKLSKDIENALISVANVNDVTGVEGKNLVNLHQAWIKMAWSTYTQEAHVNLANSYLEDERFKIFYDNIISNGTQYLVDAIKYHLT